MKTQYFDMSDQTGNQLKAILSLFHGHNPETYVNIIQSGCSYNVYPKDESPEPVLNLRWSLLGDWRVCRLTESSGDPLLARNKLRMLLHIAENITLRNHSRIDFTREAYELYNKGMDVVMPGGNYETGVDNIFKLLTEYEVIVRNLLYTSPLIVKKENDTWFKIFWYRESTETFLELTSKESVELLSGFDKTMGGALIHF